MFDLSVILSGIFLSFIGLISIIIIIWFYNDFRHRFAPNAPPLVTNWLPFIGMGLEYKENPVEFIKKYQKIHNSEVLTVYMGGRYITFLPTSNHNVDHFFRLQRQTFSFSPIAELFSEKVFDAPFDESLDKEFHQIYKRFLLSGAGLKELTQRFNECLSEFINPSKYTKDWVQHDDLLMFLFDLVWECSNKSVFFTEFTDSVIKEKLKSFDNELCNIAQMSSMPTSMIRKKFKDAYENWRSVTQYAAQFYTNGEFNVPNVSEFMKRRTKLMKENNWSSLDIARTNNLMLWASLANTIPSAFWALANVFGNIEAKQAIEDEIKSSFASFSGKSAQETFSFDRISKLSATQSCINEMLRIYFNAPSVRKVMKTSDIQLKNKDKMMLYKFHKDDLAMLSSIVCHYDEEVFKNPYDFQYDRFTNNAVFYKNNERLKKPLLPFGGGVSECPGREFAKNEIKLIFIHMINLFDIELLDNIPQQSFERIGLGIQVPKKKLPFRIKLRSQPLVDLHY